MTMWGVNINKKFEEPKIVDGFLQLNDGHIKEYRKKMIEELPPTSNRLDKISYGINAGIPIEFFVDTRQISEEDIDRLNIEEKFKNKIYSYLKYKNKSSDSSDKQDSSKSHAEENINNICIVTSDKDSYSKISNKFSKFSNIKLIHLQSYNEMTKVVLLPNVTFIVDENLSETLRKDIKTLFNLCQEQEVDFKFIDISNNLGTGENIFKLEEINVAVAELIYKNKWNEIKNISDINVKREALDKGEEVEEVEPFLDSEEDTNDEYYSDSEKENELENILKEKQESNNVNSEEIERLKNYVEDLKKDTEEKLKIKDEQIKIANDQILFLKEQNKSSQEKIKFYTNKMREYTETIEELKDEVDRLRVIEEIYESIKDEYRELKDLKQNHEKEIQDLKSKYEEKIEQYKDLIETLEKINKEMQEEIESSYENNIEVDFFIHDIKTDKNVLYFKVINEPTYFNYMLNCLKTLVNNEGEKILIVLFKRETYYDKDIYNDWINIKNIKEDIDIYNHDHKILIYKLTKKDSTRLKDIIDKYKYTIILDYHCKERNYVYGDNVKNIYVFRNNKVKNSLNLEGYTISNDEDSLVDLSYDEKFTKWSNIRVKQKFYEKRLNNLVNLMKGEKEDG